MKKTNYQKLMLSELKKINEKIDIVLLARMKDLPKKCSELLDESKYIKLEMKSYMSPQYLFDECKKLFPMYLWIDLENVTSERKGDYTVYFKNVQEADEENQNLSANDCKEKGIKGITLEERLLLEIVYFKKTGNHLDVDNLTICSGSRAADGGVPSVYWRSGRREVDVGWTDSSGSGSRWRSRSARFLS